jgi:hypothetical protein
MGFKIAVIIGGVSRDYKRNYEQFFKMLGNENVDIYIYTWNLFRDSGDIHKKFTELNNTFRPIKSEMHDYDSFSKTIDDRVAFFNSLKWIQGGFNLRTGLMAQHYTIKKAFEMIPDYSDYDIIIRYRFDWQPLFVLDWDTIYTLSRNNLLYPNQKTPGLKGDVAKVVYGAEDGVYRINDLFAIGSAEIMKTYCSLFDTMLTDEYIDDVKKTGCFIPEYIMALHLERNGVCKLAYDFPYFNISKVTDRKLGG